MDKNVVEKIRINYASGKYDMLELLLAYKDIIKGQDISDILTYTVFPGVKSGLIQRIIEVPIAQMAYSNYQGKLRVLADKAEVMELKGAKHYPYQEQALVAKEELLAEIKDLKTIKFEDLRGFYLIDEKAE